MASVDGRALQIVRDEDLIQRRDTRALEARGTRDEGASSIENPRQRVSEQGVDEQSRRREHEIISMEMMSRRRFSRSASTPP